jgi:entericidin B
MKKSILLILICLTLAAIGSGCNTTRGVGEDVQAAGKGIQNAADKNQ